MENKVKSIKDLRQIPRIGISLATDLWKNWGYFYC